MNGCQESQMCEDAPIVNPIISIDQKRCTKCGEVKKLSEFAKQTARIDGLRTACKECSNKESKKWRADNKDVIKKYNKKWKANNKERVNAALVRWRKKNPEKVKDSIKKWKKNNPEKVRELSKRNDKKRRGSPKGKLCNRMSSGIRISLKYGKSGNHWEDLVGYTVDELKVHLEKLFISGMTWGNMEKWHIDHKVPISIFNYEKPEHIDFKRCWALNNLQPMWATQNIIKGAKINKPFQPTLMI